MAAIEGGMIVGDRKKRKHCKSTQNSRVSITVVECGNAAGCDGPSMYLMQGQIPGNLRGLFGNSSWLEKSGAPPRSFVVPTPTAYMTDDAWDAAAEPLASGIRGMSVIKHYPNFWIVLYLDGFKSHVMTYRAQDIFWKHKILVVKENSDSSQVNQV